MVRRFYADVAMDDLLGPMFDDVARVDWSEHLPKLTAFWCRALLDMPGYTGNPFRAHALVHDQRAFTLAHFERWLSLFHETLDLGWDGPNVGRAHQLADNVARVHGQQLIGRAEAPSAKGERVTHLDLLSIARNMRRAAAGDDTRRLHSELTHLRAALMDHIASEQGELDALPDSTGRIARDGQRRLLRLVSDVLFNNSDANGDCNCLVRAFEIELALRRQARLETAIRRAAATPHLRRDAHI